MGQPVYIINPVGGENVTPWVPGSTYQDLEFNAEFQGSAGYTLPNPSPKTNSISTVAGMQGPLYKWVRIKAVSEKSLVIAIDANGLYNTPLYYDSNLSKWSVNGCGGAQQ